MKKFALSLAASLVLIALGTIPANAQSKNKVKETITTKAISTTSAEADALMRPANDRNHPMEKSRGDVYGKDYSDIIIDNWTGYTIDIYVDGNYRGTISPWDKRTTWAIPGNTKLYAKAVFSDGSYLYWGPSTVKTGYEYTWQLNN